METNIETILIYFFVGFICLLVVFIMVVLPIILTKEYNKDIQNKKEQKQKNKNRHIRFDTPFCSFLWDDQADPGYEGEIEWEYNPENDKSCSLFFDTDNPVSPPEGGDAKLAMAKSEYLQSRFIVICVKYSNVDHLAIRCSKESELWINILK